MYVTDTNKFISYLSEKRQRYLAAWEKGGCTNTHLENKITEYGRKITLIEREIEAMADEMNSQKGRAGLVPRPDA